MDNESFHKLLSYFNLSQSGYRKVLKGVKKRIVRHMGELGCKTMDGYLEILEKNPQIVAESRQLLTVSISRFFRDKFLWEKLGEKILPGLLSEDKFGNSALFRVWSCGCARGEEIYSFMIIWDQLREKEKDLPPLEPIATDMNSEYLEMARDGVYEGRSLKEVPEELVGKYFTKLGKKNKFVFSSRLKYRVVFKRHDFLTEPPPADRFNIIFVRNNLLTYYRSGQMEKAFKQVANALVRKGVLVVGSHEKIPEAMESLTRHADIAWLYSKEDFS